VAEQKLELTVKVNSETGQLDVVGQKLKTMGTEAAGAGTKMEKASGASTDFVKSLIPFVGVVGGASFAIHKLTGFVSDSIKESESYRQTVLRMQSALETTGGSWKKSGAEIEAWAGALQKSTRFGDSQALATLDRLTRATGNLGVAQKAATLAMDISVKTGRDLGFVTELITKMVLGQNRALLEVQKEFGNVTAGATNTKQALAQLANAYEGAAIAERTITSETAKLANEWGDFKKSIGNAITPALLTLTETLNGIFPALSKIGVVLKSYFTKGGLGTIVDYKDIQAAFAAIDSEAKKSAEGVAKLKNETGGLADALKNFTPPKLDIKDDEAEKEKRQKALADAESERLADAERATRMAEDLDSRLLAINQDTLQQKIALIDQETEAKKRRVDTEIKDEQRGAALKVKLEQVATKEKIKLSEIEMQMKRNMAFSAVEMSLQTLSIINSMQSGHTKAQLARARVILALEKTIAIARLWAAEAGKGVAGIALASAGTALIVAQFAQQSKALGDASKMSDGSKEFSTSVDLGNGQTFTETDTVGGQSGTSTSGGVSSLGSRSGGGSTSGGGGGAIINVGGVVVNFTADNVDLSTIQVVARRLGEEVLRRTTEGVHLAVAVRNVGEENSNLAV
jgi:hypothetical protein